MTDALTTSQLSILHVLRDGDDPAQGLAADELLALQADLVQLVRSGFIEQTGAKSALTLAGLDELSKPGNAQPMTSDELAQYARKLAR
jgi:hypothetical protein